MSRHIFDENFSAPMMEIIRNKLSSVTQVGKDWGQAGWKDLDQIIPHLHGSGATSHTLDSGFYDWRLWHMEYCLVYYDVPEAEIIEWIFKLLNKISIKHFVYNPPINSFQEFDNLINSKN